MKNAFWIFGIALLVLFVFIPSFSRVQNLKERNDTYQKQIEQLKTKNAQLVEEKRLLIEDPVYLEKVAREKMGLVKEGEFIYRLVPMNEEKQ